jgi:pyridoxine 4-dehydrogenase
MPEAPEQRRFTLRHAAVMVAVAAMWGSSFLLIAVSTSQLAPPLVALLRVAFGAGVLGLVPAARRRVASAAWPAIVGLAIVWMAGPFVLFAAAERSVDSSVAGVLNASAPLFTAVVAAVWVRQRPPGRQFWGLLVGFLGVVLVCAPSVRSRHDGALGVGLVLVAVLLYGVAFNITGGLQRTQGALPVIWRAQLVALLVLLIPGIETAPESHLQSSGLVAVAALGVACTALGFVLFSWLAGSVGATRAAITTYFLPLVAIGFGSQFRGDRVTVWLFGGVPLILLGAYFATRAPAQTRSGESVHRHERRRTRSDPHPHRASAIRTRSGRKGWRQPPPIPHPSTTAAPHAQPERPRVTWGNNSTPLKGDDMPSHSRTLTIGGDLTVGRLGFGAMRLTGPPAWLDRQTARGIARRAVALGVTFIDTADSYDFGENEELLAEALYPYPESLAIATKGGQVNLGEDWIPLGRPEYLRQQAELSLRRLRLGHIELYQLHRIDPTVPLADQIGALRLLQEQGKIRHVGLSEVTVEQLKEAEQITPIASVQNRYNLADRSAEDVLHYCERHGIAFIPWFPVAPITRGHSTDPTDAIAKRHGATPAQIALAWLLHHSPVILPIPGTSQLAHLEENLAALRLSLAADDLATLDEVDDPQAETAAVVPAETGRPGAGR